MNFTSFRKKLNKSQKLRNTNELSIATQTGFIYLKFRNIVEINCVVRDVCLFVKMIERSKEIMIIKVRVVVPPGRRKRVTDRERPTGASKVVIMFCFLA